MLINEVGWTVTLSKKKITFLPTFLLYFLIWKLKVSRTISKNFTYIQDLESSKWETSASFSGALANRKHLGLFLRHITIGITTFLLSTLTKNAVVILCFDVFSSLAFFSFWAKLFAGNASKKQPLSSMLQIYLWSYPLQSSFIRSIQDSTVVSKTPERLARNLPFFNTVAYFPFINPTFRRFETIESWKTYRLSNINGFLFK